LKFVRRRLESTIERYSVERCCIVFSPRLHYLRTVFVLSFSSYVVHIFKTRI